MTFSIVARDSTGAFGSAISSSSPAVAARCVHLSDGVGVVNSQNITDPRLGPVLEAFINGRYYWVPFARLSQVRIEPPEDLRDCVWMPAHLQFENGGETLALVPTRYEGTQDSGDGALMLARATRWREWAPEVWVGFGQRLLGSDQGEYALMDVRQIDFSPAPGGDG